tara:strand:+ start:1563 stop:1928 length:366 start_codon:yes stop_codon:yes gene_type:complete
MKKFFFIFLTILTFNLQSFANELSQKEIEILKNLRCIVCQGQSIADSNSDFAQIIKLVVKEQVKSKKSEKDIYNFLVNNYGEWIVYKPLLNRTNFILWALPYLALLFGGLIILMIFKKKGQ